MNANDIANMDLDSVGSVISEETTTPVAEVSAEVTEVVTEVAEVVTEVADTPADDVQTDEASADNVTPIVAARKKAGRKFDTTGTTNLGKCRKLYEQNPTFTPKQLKTLFVSETGIAETVAQTYASIVRRPKKAAAA